MKKATIRCPQTRNAIHFNRSTRVFSRWASTKTQNIETNEVYSRNIYASQVQSERNHNVKNEATQDLKKSPILYNDNIFSETNSQRLSLHKPSIQKRKYFDELGQTLGIKNLDEWYEKLSPKILKEFDERWTYYSFGGSPTSALIEAYPEHNWILWKFNNVPTNYWKSIENQRKYFDWLGKEIGVKELDDWYQKISSDVVQQHCGGGLLKNHKKSSIAALMAVYPEHNWMIWKFNMVPQRFWKSMENQRKYFDWLGKELGIKKLDDWYEKLTVDVLRQHHGGGLLANHHNSSAAAALMAAYPEHNWIPWKFSVTPQGYWIPIEHQRKYFDWLSKEIGIQTLDDWYEKLSTQLILQHFGAGLLNIHNSPPSALMAAYPEHNWIPWKFNAVPTDCWSSKDNVKRFLSEVSEKLSIQTLDDWYRVDNAQLDMVGMRTIIGKGLTGLYNLLKEQYPHHPWDINGFKKGTKKGQRWLAVTLKKMFPNEEILEDYQHPKAVSQISNRPLQLDVFIPSKSLAFEYQGKQHYEDIGVFSPTRTCQKRDEEKRILCAANNIKLIEVPYWWNRTQESLHEMMTKNQL